MLGLLLLINLKLDAQRAKPYEYWTRAICLIGMYLSTRVEARAYYLTGILRPHAYVIFVLLYGLLLIFPQFLVTDYVQYRKNRDDPEAVRRMLKSAIRYLAVAEVAFAGLLLMVAAQELRGGG
ncbi:hypothetical protein SDC9_96403 [bioreactor metagenome]|uniref:Uncharacterized protein n=1 Tax=bioreactor metagenome TaxID=1076179 RepID=A0A645AFS0_9ZZZZ